MQATEKYTSILVKESLIDVYCKDGVYGENTQKCSVGNRCHVLFDNLPYFSY
jgi:hypothetical protein